MSSITKSPAKQLRARRKQREREEGEQKKDEAADVSASGDQQPAAKPPVEDPEEKQLSKYIKDPNLIYKMKQRNFDALYDPFLKGCRIDLAVVSIILITAYCLFDAGSMNAFWECDKAQLSNVTLPTYIFLCSRPHTYPPNWIFNFQTTRSLKMEYLLSIGYLTTNHTRLWFETGENEELAFIKPVDYSNHLDHIVDKQAQSLLKEQERMKNAFFGDSETKYVPVEKRMNVIGQAFAEMRKNSTPWSPNVGATLLLDRTLGLFVWCFKILVESGQLPFFVFIVVCYHILPTIVLYIALKPLIAKIFRHWTYVRLLIDNKLFYWFGMNP